MFEALEGARGGVTPSVMAVLQGCDPGCHVVVEVDLECPHHLAALMRLAHKAGKAARTTEGEWEAAITATVVARGPSGTGAVV